MAKDLTITALKNLKPGSTRREVPDGHTRGLFFVIQPTGAASWAYRYRFAGKPKKLTLGTFPAIDLKTARELVSKAARQMALGVDPAAEKQAARAVAREAAGHDHELVENVIDTFVERYARAKTRSWQETERMLKKEIAGPWRGRRLSTIGRADVHALLDGIIDRGAPASANRILAAFRRMCSWAVERGIVKSSPCQGIKAPTAMCSRDRVLTDDEIRVIWRALEKVGWPFGPLAQLLLLTGARLREVAEARWEDIDFASKRIVVSGERSKNRVAHEIPLSDTALKIIESLPRVSDGRSSNFVLTTTGRTPVSGFSRAKEQIDAAIFEIIGSAPEPWVIHDLRRTAASGMAGLGIAPHIVEAVLNHKSGTIKGVAAVYNRYSYNVEKRDALDRWARHVERVVGGAGEGKVVEMASVGA